MSNVKKNYAYNLIYQIFIILTPFITTPYISRVLGSAGVGQYSFSTSISSYFIILATFGFNLYAQREIAKHQGSISEQTRIFWEVFICRVIFVGAALLIYIFLLLIGVFEQEYISILWVLGINIFAVSLDVTYFFQGNEKFGFIAVRNVIIKIIGIILVFAFIKNSSQVWLYSLINSLIVIISNISLWPKLLKSITKVSFKGLNIKKHIIPSFKLFIPTIASSVYTILDKTLIGVLVPGTIDVVLDDGTIIIHNISDIENGYYEQSEKIVKMVLTIITALGTVMIPKNSSLFAKGEIEKVKNNVYSSFIFVAMIGFPIMFGLIGISHNFSLWFFGEGYDKVPFLICIFSPLIIFIGSSNVLGMQYIMPSGRDKLFIYSITSGALINIILNIILIPFLYSYGAAISTIVAELLIFIIQIVSLRKEFSIKRIFLQTYKYLIFAGIMGTVVFLLDYYIFESSILNTILLIIIGCVVYFIFLIISNDKQLVNLVKILKKSKKKE